MATLDLHESVSTEAGDDVLEKLQEFYRANGYEISAGGDDDTVLMTRGESGSGWWSSNMTELASTVTLVSRGATVEIHYDVDVSGQYLTDEDRTFWSNEIAKAKKYAMGGLEKPTDLRKAEEQRADKGFSSRIYVGIWGAFLIAVVIIMLGFFGII